MTNTEGEQPTSLSSEVVAEIRRQSVKEVSRYAILAFIALVGIAASGWWFYLQQKIDRYIETHAGGVPASAVVAFDAPNKCPIGWTEFDPAAGNVVIGISAKHHYRDSAGAETHQLKVAELPPRVLSVDINEAATSTVDRLNAGGHDYYVVNRSPKTIKLDLGGAGDAFLTMPPYVTLRYCKKD